jgi:hypothetical protein
MYFEINGNKLYIGLTVLWLLITFFTSKCEAAHDGFNEVGYPFVFYRDFNGKADYGLLDLGLHCGYLALDIGIALLVFFVVMKVRDKFFKKV